MAKMESVEGTAPEPEFLTKYPGFIYMRTDRTPDEVIDLHGERWLAVATDVALRIGRLMRSTGGEPMCIDGTLTVDVFHAGRFVRYVGAKVHVDRHLKPGQLCLPDGTLLDGYGERS